MATVPTLTLNDGIVIPQIGFGTWQVPDEEAQKSVEKALEVGYRHIDTAAVYGNEAGVGRAIKASGIAPDELFVTTKLWNTNHEKDDARRAVEESLEKLGLDRVDLYLMHWPSTVKHGDAYIEAWNAMQEFKAEGLARSIGVSNFLRQHLDAIEGETPSVDQIELHPTFQQRELAALLAQRGIDVESYSPLGSGADLDNAEIKAIGDSLGKSIGQVIIRWHLQKGYIVLPKSVTPARIEENFDVFGFELTAEQMATIDGLDAGNRVGSDPETADF